MTITMKTAARGASPNTLWYTINHWASSGVRRTPRSKPTHTVNFSMGAQATRTTTGQTEKLTRLSVSQYRRSPLRLKCTLLTNEFSRYIRFSRSHTTRQTLECGELAARTALARSNDIALEARWHHLSLLFSRLGTLRHGAREWSPRTQLAFPTHSRQSRTPGGEDDEMSRFRGGHRAPQKFAREKRSREFRTARVSANVKWRLVLTRSFSTLVRKCPTGSV